MDGYTLRGISKEYTFIGDMADGNKIRHKLRSGGSSIVKDMALGNALLLMETETCVIKGDTA